MVKDNDMSGRRRLSDNLNTHFICQPFAAYALCIKNEQTSTFDMYLRVKLNQDPVGALRAINNVDAKESPPAYTPITCVVNYDAVNKVYTVISRYDPDGTNDDNMCGVVSMVLLARRSFARFEGYPIAFRA